MADFECLTSLGKQQRKKNLVEDGAKELGNKLKTLSGLVDQLRTEEDHIQEQLRNSLLELRNEIEHAESKQRKIQDYLRTIPRID